MISGIVGIGISAYVIQRGGTTFSIAAAVLAVEMWGTASLVVSTINVPDRTESG